VSYEKNFLNLGCLYHVKKLLQHEAKKYKRPRNPTTLTAGRLDKNKMLPNAHFLLLSISFALKTIKDQ